MNEQNHLDMCHEAHGILSGISYDLADLAKAFYVTGNKVMGKHLDSLAIEVRVNAKQMMDAYSLQLTGRFNDAVQSSNNVLSAVLAGIKVGEEQDNA